MNKYTIALRVENYDDIDFFPVEAHSLIEGIEIAKKECRDSLDGDEEEKDERVIYVEFAFLGHIVPIYTTHGYGTSDEELKKL